MEQPLKIICRVVTLKHYLKQDEFFLKKSCLSNCLETKGRETKGINKRQHISGLTLQPLVYIKRQFSSGVLETHLVYASCTKPFLLQIFLYDIL